MPAATFSLIWLLEVVAKLIFQFQIRLLTAEKRAQTQRQGYKTIRRSSQASLSLTISGDGSGETIPIGRLFFELLPPEPRQE